MTHTMVAKPIQSLELHYTMIQFLKIYVVALPQFRKSIFFFGRGVGVGGGGGEEMLRLLNDPLVIFERA